MTPEARSVIETLAGLSPKLPELRERAKIICAANPIAWLIVHGVSLADYLAEVDKLAEVCREAEAKLREPCA